MRFFSRILPLPLLRLHVARHERYLLAGTALLFLGTFLGLAPPYFLKLAIDDLLPGRDPRALWLLAAVLLAVVSTRVLVEFSRQLLLAWTGQRIMEEMRGRLFAKLTRLPVDYHQRNPAGQTITRLTTDVEAQNQLLISGLAGLASDSFTLLGIAIWLVVLSPRLALLTLAGLPLLALAVLFYRRLIARVFARYRLALGELGAWLHEHLLGMRVIQLFAQERRKLAQLERHANSVLGHSLAYISLYSAFVPLFHLLTIAAMACILWWGGSRLLAGTPLVPLGVLVAFLGYLDRCYGPLLGLAQTFGVLESARAAAARITALLDAAEQALGAEGDGGRGEVGEAGGTGEVGEVCLTRDSLPRARQPIEQIVFRRVCFSYEPGHPVLREVSLALAHGQRIGLVGHTAAGKSTLVNLLERFYPPDSGEIEVNRRPIASWSLRALRREIGLVPQSAALFSASLRDNLTLGDEAIETAQIDETLHALGLDGWLRRFPRGYDTLLREPARTLSAGECQLIGLARALLRQPSLMIIDEATASIDAETEALLGEALARMLDGRMAMVIAHRLATVRRLDRILVLDGGRIVEQGTHHELLEQDGHYRRLLQSGGGDLATASP